jgi:hypothetical protein
MPAWTFLTNHAHVFLCVVKDPEARLRDIADIVGITERATQRIMSDLVETGYIERDKAGRRNVYRVPPGLPMRHPMDRHADLDQLVSVLTGFAPGEHPAATEDEPRSPEDAPRDGPTAS